jgi:hypothetical protein
LTLCQNRDGRCGQEGESEGIYLLTQKKICCLRPPWKTAICDVLVNIVLIFLFLAREQRVSLGINLMLTALVASNQ